MDLSLRRSNKTALFADFWQHTNNTDITGGGISNHSDDVVTAQLHSSAVIDNDMETTITCHYDA